MSLYRYVIGQSKIQIICGWHIGLEIRRPWVQVPPWLLAGFVLGCPELKSSGICTESWILAKVLKFAQQFFRPGNCLENRDKFWKNGKKSQGFFFQRYNLQVNFFSNLIQSWQYVCSASWKKLCSCFFRVYIDHLLITLSLEKTLFGKKVLNFGSKNLYKPSILGQACK